MTTRVENTIYKFSNPLWGGHLASSTSSSRLYPQNIFLTHSGEAIFDFARTFFVFIGQKIPTLASQFHSLIGIGFSFSTAIVRSDAQMIAFLRQL